MCAVNSPRTSATIFGDELYPHHPPHPHPSSLPPHPSSYQLPAPPPPPPSSSTSALFHPWFRTGQPHSRMSAEDEVSSHNSPGPLSAHFSPLTHSKSSTSTSFSNSQGPVKVSPPLVYCATSSLSLSFLVSFSSLLFSAHSLAVRLSPQQPTLDSLLYFLLVFSRATLPLSCAVCSLSLSYLFTLFLLLSSCLCCL